MTTTDTPAPAQPVTTCPPSRVVDMIVHWDEVQAGELVLDKYQFVTTHERDDSYSEPAYVGFRIGEHANGDPRWIWRRRDHYTAVRRYTEGLVTIPATLAQTAAAALDENADDRSDRAGTGCRDCAEAPGRYCDGCQESLQRAGEYREARDELLEACRG